MKQDKCELILFIQIEKKREELIHLGMKHGLTSLETIHASQQLDRLLNQLRLQDASIINNL